MNVSLSGTSSSFLGQYDGTMQQDTSGILLGHQAQDSPLSGNESIGDGIISGLDEADDEVYVQNISTVLLQPIIRQQDFMDQLMFALDLYYTPGIIAIGFAANIYISFVLRNSQFSKFSVTPYMSALTVCDTAYLSATLFIWLQQVHGIQVLINNGFCQIVWFTRYVCNFLSIWYLVCLQIDRYISMWHPTKAHHKTSNRHSRCITSILGILGVVIYSLMLWTSSVHKEITNRDKFVCNYIDRFMDIVRIFVKADTFVTAVMPYSMLPMVNIIICLQIMIKCCGLQKYKRPPPNSAIRSSRTWNNIKKTKKQVWLTMSLLIVSSIVWCLNILSQWLRIKNFFRFESSDLDLMASKHRDHYIWHLADHLFHLSFAVKLLLYLVFSGLFRTSVLECCRSYQCICAQGNDGDDSSSTCEHCECEHSYDGSLEALPPLDPDVDNNMDNLSDLHPVNSDNSPCDDGHSPNVDYSHLAHQHHHPTQNHVSSNHIIRRDTTV